MLTVVHVGYMKTATSTLQEHLFAKHPRLACIAKPAFTPTGNEIRDALVGADTTKELLAALRTKFAAESPNWRDKIVVFSYENLSIVPRKNQEHLPVVDRIGEVFGRPKILITIRNQLDFLESLYVYRTRSLEHYLSFPDFLKRAFEDDGLNLDFYSFAAPFAERFGKDHVGIFPIEQLRHDAQAYFQRLADFIGLDASSVQSCLEGRSSNVRRSHRLLTFAKLRAKIPVPSLSRYFPRLGKAAERFLLRGQSERIKFPSAWADLVRERYAASNANLMSEYRLELDRWGYPLTQG